MLFLPSFTHLTLGYEQLSLSMESKSVSVFQQLYNIPF